MPFADYKNFDACMSANSDKEDPAAYCAEIHKKATGRWPTEKEMKEAKTTLEYKYKKEKLQLMEEIKKMEGEIKKNENPIQANPSNPRNPTQVRDSKNVPEDKEAEEEKKILIKEVEKLEKLIAKKQKKEDLLEGGISDNIPAEQFDPAELEKGIRVEMEHTSDVAIATEIAKDHLAEDPEYYKKLAKMEAGKENITVSQYLSSKKEIKHQVKNINKK